MVVSVIFTFVPSAPLDGGAATVSNTGLCSVTVTTTSSVSPFCTHDTASLVRKRYFFETALSM